MAVRLFNTRTQKTEPFTPRTPGEAKIYVCGMTTYDLAHAGHGRTLTTFDVLARHLRARGFKVTFVRNVTDVDDKIVKRAKERGEDPLALSARFSDLCDAQLRTLGCQDPTHEPRVSAHVGDVVALIEQLVAKGHAYPAATEKGHDVYFAVRSFAPYGKLSQRKVDELQAGARVEVGDVKRDPLDFALWKAALDSELGWSSPWGRGRPGWHIECSAMAERFLGPHFDIHGGGMDLIFPHHENEIAQAEAVWGPEFANVWMHAGFLNVDDEKMSKSLGNFVTLEDVLARNDPEAFRYFVLGTHYRGPLAFDVAQVGVGADAKRTVFPGVDEAERRVDYLYHTRDALVVAAEGAEAAATNVLQGQAKVVDEASARVLAALDKDLNTPVALAVLGELAKAANEIVVQIGKLKDKAVRHSARTLAARAIHALDGSVAPLGLMQASSEEYQARTTKRRLALRRLDAQAVEARVQARAEARGSKDFARADSLRKELAELGIEVLDVEGGSRWRVSV